jgi:transposase
VRVEQVAWARPGSRFTYAFEEMAAYLAQSTDKTKVTKLLGLSWSAVGSIVERVIAERLDKTRFDGVTSIGIDEFSYRKRHRYITVVVDHDRKRVIWAGEGQGASAANAFFDLLGEARCSQIQLVTMDMSGGYKKAVDERLPNAEIVYDLFHVLRLAANAVDEVRRDEVRKATGERARMLKKTRYPLLRNPATLSDRDRSVLQRVRRASKPLSRSYELKETLAEILELDDLKLATGLLTDWVAWAQRSRLKPFIKLARTIRKHAQGVLGYVRTLHTNGRVEGFNNRLRMIARRAYGFHSPKPLIAMLFLNCGGIQLHPALPGTHSK